MSTGPQAVRYQCRLQPDRAGAVGDASDCLALSGPVDASPFPRDICGNRSAQISPQLIGNAAPCLAVDVACDEGATAFGNRVAEDLLRVPFFLDPTRMKEDGPARDLGSKRHLMRHDEHGAAFGR